MKSFCQLSAPPGLMLAIPLSIFLHSCLYNKSGPKDGNDLSGMNLNGRVKSMTETILNSEEILTGVQNKGNFISQIQLFDKRGRKLEEKYYLSDSSLSSRIVYRYNAYGYLVEKSITDNKGTTDSRILYKYDENNNLYQKVELDHLSYLIYRETYKYDRNQYEIERFIYRPSQSEWNIIISLDENGAVQKESFTDIKGASLLKILYKNDKHGNKIEEDYLKKDGSTGTRYTHKYDKKGNITETIVYNSADKMISGTRYYYDKILRQVESRHSFSEKDTEPDQILKYDKKGNITDEIIRTDFRSSRVVSEYLYDKKGNWINKIITRYSPQNGAAIAKNNIIREIEYY
jgi:hypothetical protein